MAERPYTVLSAAVSLDGCLDGGTRERLLLSTDADFDRVDALRAGCDAILVGARTVRRDDPRLVVRDAGRRAVRVSRGTTPSPAKVTVTRSGRLDPAAAFFTVGESDRLVYCPEPALAACRRRLGHAATVVGTGVGPDGGLTGVCEDLYRRGVHRLLVEGGGTVLTQLLRADLADELQLAVAPFFVGDPRARRFAGEGRYPWGPDRRAPLIDVQRVDDLAVLRYALSDRFDPDAHGVG